MHSTVKLISEIAEVECENDMLLVVCWVESGLSSEQPSRMYGIAPSLSVYGWTHFQKTVCTCVRPAKNSMPPHVRYPGWDACWQGGGDDCSSAAGAMPGICFTKASWRFRGPACWVMSYGWGFWATLQNSTSPTRHLQVALAAIKSCPGPLVHVEAAMGERKPATFSIKQGMSPKQALP